MLSAWLQLAYNETSEGTLGPFNVEAKLTSVGGSVLYATGSGRVSPPVVTSLFLKFCIFARVSTIADCPQFWVERVFDKFD